MSLTLVGTLDGWTHSYSPEFGLYSDNTPWVKGIPPEGMEIDSIVIRQNSLSDFLASIMYIESIANGGWFDDLVPDLWIPFFPGARQDRSNPTGDVLGTKSYLAHLVADLGQFVNDFVVFDLHSDKGFMPKRTVNITAGQIIAGATARGISINPTPGYYDTIIAPDHGAVARAEIVGSLYHTPVLVAEKVRDVSDGRIVSYTLPEPVSALNKVLVVDDICDGGATFEILAKSLPATTEKHLFVTHGLFSRGVVHLKHHYEHIITTNSVYRESGVGVQVIDLFPGVAL